MFSYPSILTYVLGAQNSRLSEMVLLSTHNICFGLEIRKLNFRYALLTKVLGIVLIYRWDTGLEYFDRFIICFGCSKEPSQLRRFSICFG